MQTWELVAREAIRETVAAYAWAADHGKFDDVAACFTDDGVLAVHGEAPLVGAAAIRAFLGGVGDDLRAGGAPRLIRHHTTNLQITVDSRSAARARCYFLVVSAAGLDHWGRYRDDLVPGGERWLLARREVRTDGRVPGGFADARLRDHAAPDERTSR